MVIQPCVCIAASHVGLAGLPVLAVYSSATFCISATLFCFSFTDILSKISCLNFCGAKVQLFFDIRKHLEKNLLISLLFTVIPLCQRSISFIFKYRTIVLYLFTLIRVGHNYLFCIISFSFIFVVTLWHSWHTLLGPFYSLYPVPRLYPACTLLVPQACIVLVSYLHCFT